MFFNFASVDKKSNILIKSGKLIASGTYDIVKLFSLITFPLIFNQA